MKKSWTDRAIWQIARMTARNLDTLGRDPDWTERWARVYRWVLDRGERRQLLRPDTAARARRTILEALALAQVRRELDMLRAVRHAERTQLRGGKASWN